MLYLATYYLKEGVFDEPEEKCIRLIEADSEDEAENKLYTHHDVPLSKKHPFSDEYENVGGWGTDFLIFDLEITECIK